MLGDGPMPNGVCLTLFLIAAALASDAAVKPLFSLPSPRNCTASDGALIHWKEMVCSSITQSWTWWCGDSFENVTADEDFPMQARYFGYLLDTVMAPTTCLNTTVAASVVEWINGPMANFSTGGFIGTYLGQLSYYVMPRPEGERIETPWTLGNKCWAYAYLASIWKPQQLAEAVAQANLSLAFFIQEYTAAISPTMLACMDVLANCFVNESYNPQRNGTCPLSVAMFHGGFEWENLRILENVSYPFHP